MLIRLCLMSLVAFAALAPRSAASSSGATAFFPTSTVVHMAEAIARSEGYDLSDQRRYYLDLVQGRDGKPLIAGYVMLGFYWGGDLIETIAIDDHSGLAVDTTGCRILDYPALRRYRGEASTAVVAPPGLKAQTGCDSFKIVRAPAPRVRASRR